MIIYTICLLCTSHITVEQNLRVKIYIIEVMKFYIYIFIIDI